MSTPITSRYRPSAVALHWIIGLAIIGLIVVGEYMTDLPKNTPERSWFYNMHKSIGLTVALLVILRILVRARHAPPPLPGSVPEWQVVMAKISHYLLYLCMVVMPTSGFIASNYTKFGVNFYFSLQIGPFFTPDKAMYDVFNQVHHVTATIFMILIGAHVLAALKHLFINRDGVFQRMLPGRR